MGTDDTMARILGVHGDEKRPKMAGSCATAASEAREPGGAAVVVGRVKEYGDGDGPSLAAKAVDLHERKHVKSYEVVSAGVVCVCVSAISGTE
jgi:hypothetical protein